MGYTNIKLVHKNDLKGPTDYEPGDVLNYGDNAKSADFIVVGEDEKHLHTFFLDTGGYWGGF